MNLNSKIENQKRGGKDTTPLSDIKEYVEGGVKEYVALLTQSGTDAPVATVLENTLGGEIVWTYEDAGTYMGTLLNAFTPNKTNIETPVFYQIAAEDYTSVASQQGYIIYRSGNNTCTIISADGEDIRANNKLYKSIIEIKVYP